MTPLSFPSLLTFPSRFRFARDVTPLVACCHRSYTNTVEQSQGPINYATGRFTPHRASAVPETRLMPRSPHWVRHEEMQKEQRLTPDGYNAALSRHISKCESWIALLQWMRAELFNLKPTERDAKSSHSIRVVNLRQKYKQWSCKTILILVKKLIQTRSTRKKLQRLPADEERSLMWTLEHVLVAIECSFIRLHDEKGVWKHIHYPYLYLRQFVDDWYKKERQKSEKNMMMSTSGEMENQEKNASNEGFLTEKEFKARTEQLRQAKATAERLADEVKDNEVEPPERHRWALGTTEDEMRDRLAAEREVMGSLKESQSSDIEPTSTSRRSKRPKASLHDDNFVGDNTPDEELPRALRPESRTRPRDNQHVPKFFGPASVKKKQRGTRYFD